MNACLSVETLVVNNCNTTLLLFYTQASSTLFQPLFNHSSPLLLNHILATYLFVMSGGGGRGLFCCVSFYMSSSFLILRGGGLSAVDVGSPLVSLGLYCCSMMMIARQRAHLLLTVVVVFVVAVIRDALSGCGCAVLQQATGRVL